MNGIKRILIIGSFVFLLLGLIKTQVLALDCVSGSLPCLVDNYCRGQCGPGWLCDLSTGSPTKDHCVSAFGEATFENNKLAGYFLTGTGLNDLISNVILSVGAIVGLVFFALLVMGGISYMTAGGDDKALLKAKNQIMHAMVGLMIVFFAYWIVRIIGAVFGINLLSPTFTGP